jgi:hypothetical protein
VQDPYFSISLGALLAQNMQNSDDFYEKLAAWMPFSQVMQTHRLILECSYPKYISLRKTSPVALLRC